MTFRAEPLKRLTSKREKFTETAIQRSGESKNRREKADIFNGGQRAKTECPGKPLAVEWRAVTIGNCWRI